MMKSSFLAFVVLAVSGYTQASTYTRTLNLFGQQLLDAFSWYAQPDPTHGRVEYVTKSVAQANGLYSVSGNTVILRADNTTVLNPSGPGRKAFRLQSNAHFTNHVAIFDVAHMPQGCGTWPSICELLEVGPNWPKGGEVDIIEGINDVVPNQSTLHTSGTCTMPQSRPMTGTSMRNDCDVYTTRNAGCGIHLDNNSFGPNFNNVGGGWYAIERSPEHIAIYFWERNNPSVPSQVKNPGNNVDPSTWGTAAAYFPNTECNFAEYLGPMIIIINLTFCGDWAGSAYHSSKCPSTCVDYVNNNPGAFSEAFFAINSMSVFE